jgi:syntaxin 1B/2/3
MADEQILNSLQKLSKVNSNLQRQKVKFGGNGDTVSFRRKIERSLQDGRSYIRTADAKVTSVSGQSYTGANGKVVQQYRTEKERFEELDMEIRKLMGQHVPINDGGSVEDPDGDDGGDGPNGYAQGQSQIQSELGMEVVQGRLEEVEHTHEQMGKMVQNLNELHGAVQDLKELVDDQQDGLDTVQKNVQDVKTNVDSGVLNVQKAEEQERAYRKKQCYALICLLIIAIIIIASVCGSGACK